MRVIIVEDEIVVAKWLEKALVKTGSVTVEQIVLNPLKVIDAIQKIQPDVVFMDIEMPECSGLEVAQKISELADPPSVVFVTAYNEYAIEAFKVDALDYLLKPIESRDLSRVLDKIEKKVKPKKDKYAQVFVQALGGINVMLSSGKQLKWPTVKCEELFAYLILKPDFRADKWQIIDILWPDKDEEKGQTNLRTAVYRINQTFNELDIDCRIKADKSTYRIKCNDIKLDIQVLEDLANGKTKININDPDPIVLNKIKKTYPGAVLTGKDYLWAQSLTAYYEKLFLQLTNKIVEQLKQQPQRALLTYEILQFMLSQQPFDDNLIIENLTYTMQIEGQTALIKSYEAIKRDMLQELDIEPGASITQHYHQLLDSDS